VDEMRLPVFSREKNSNTTPNDRLYVAGDNIAGRFSVLDRFEGGLGIVYLECV
jgi:hypothetical protein